MTKEELLKPRYKVIADWPRENKYDSLVGTIYTLPDLSKELSPISGQVIKNHLEDWCAYYNHYPHLFQRLPWYAERKPEDMPEYLKNKNDRIYKAVEHFTGPNKDGFKPEDDGYYESMCRYYREYEPSTIEEYTLKLK